MESSGYGKELVSAASLFAITWLFSLGRDSNDVRIPDEKMAPADLAVPYDAPMTVKTMAQAQPIAPKKDCICEHL